MTAGSHLKFWIIGILIIILVSPIMATKKEISERVQVELRSVEQAFGQKRTLALMVATDSAYKEMFVATGLVGQLNKAKTSEPKKVDSLTGSADRVVAIVGEWTNNYVEAFAANTYSVMLRLAIIGEWLWLLLPFLVACVIDGVVRRKIKQSAFGFFSPQYFSYGLHAVLISVFAPAIYLFLPFMVSPSFTPVWGVVMGMVVMTTIPHATRIGG